MTLPDTGSQGKAKTHVLDLEPLQGTTEAGKQAVVPQAAAVKKPAAERPVVYEARLAQIPGLGSLQAAANRSFQPRPQPEEPATPLLGSINLTPQGHPGSSSRRRSPPR